MSEIVTTAVPAGFIMVSESRQITASSKWLEDMKNGKFGPDFKIVGDTFPKTFLLGDRYGLSLTGNGFEINWSWDDEVRKLNEMALEGKDIGHLANCLMTALTDGPGDSDIKDFTFHLTGYEKGYPVLAHGDLKDGLVLWGGKGNKTSPLRHGMYNAGTINIIKKIFADEIVGFNNMDLLDAAEFSILTMMAGVRYLGWFQAYQPVAGGPLNLAIITPRKSKLIVLPGNLLEWRGVDIFA